MLGFEGNRSAKAYPLIPLGVTQNFKKKKKKKVSAKQIHMDKFL